MGYSNTKCQPPLLRFFSPARYLVSVIANLASPAATQGDVSAPLSLASGTLLDVGFDPTERWDATLTSTVTFDPSSKALQFASTGDWVTFGPTTIISSPLTFVVMVKINTVQGVSRVWDFNDAGNPAGAAATRLSLTIQDNTGTGVVTLYNADGSVAASASSPAPLWVAGVWNHVAFTLKSSGQGALFLNGQPVGFPFTFATIAPASRMGFFGRGPATGTVPSEVWFHGEAFFVACVRKCCLLWQRVSLLLL